MYLTGAPHPSLGSHGRLDLNVPSNKLWIVPVCSSSLPFQSQWSLFRLKIKKSSVTPPFCFSSFTPNTTTQQILWLNIRFKSRLSHHSSPFIISYIHQPPFLSAVITWWWWLLSDVPASTWGPWSLFSSRTSCKKSWPIMLVFCSDPSHNVSFHLE